MGIISSERITRVSSTLVVEGIRVDTMGALCAAIGSAVDSCIATDLSLGAWRGCQAATELEAQTGLTSATRCGVELAPLITGELVPTYADFVGTAIDAESSGDQTIIDALQRATLLASVLRAGMTRCCLVSAPRYGLTWEKHDALLIRFLAEGLRESRCRLVLVSGTDEEPTLPDGWIVRWRAVRSREKIARSKCLLGLVPGVVEPDLAAAMEASDPLCAVAHLPLTKGRILLAPECRRPPAKVSRLEYDRLAVVTRSIGWLAAYAQYFGNNFHINPYFLCKEAGQRLGEGGHQIALRLLERAVACATSPEVSTMCQSYAQGMRIALQQFQEAADAAEPPRSAPAPLRGFLLQCKGWGLVMSGQAAKAERCLREALALLTPWLKNREYSYLLNISALAALKLGNLDGALAVEQSIEASLSDPVRRDWHLWYINSINIARLHLRRGNMETAALYYQRAFETTTGVRSDSDGIYANVCRARVCARQGRPGETLLAWLRAGLYWVSTSAPEAVAPRVIRGILGPSLVAGEDLVEQVSAILTEQLRVASGGAGIALSTSPLGIRPIFVRSIDLAEELPPEAIPYAAGTAGCSILASSWVVAPAFSGYCYDGLCCVLRELLQKLIHDDIAEFKTLVVDDRLGQEIPATRAELLGTCLRLGIPQMRFGHDTFDFNEDLRRRLEMASLVQLGKAVDQVEFVDGNAIVTFKRYLAPRVVPGEDAAILDAIADRPGLAQLARRLVKPLSVVLASIRLLERARVVNVELENDSYALQGLVQRRL
jgi:tetratricopeptide (TPR) repeat protein